MTKLHWFLISIMIALALVGIGFLIYVYIRYANVPLKDLPTWALPFFNK